MWIFLVIGKVLNEHSDPYENIYTVIRGAKYFTLFPPTEAWRMKGKSNHWSANHFLTKLERLYPHAQYKRDGPLDVLRLVPSDPTSPKVRWSSIKDPLDATEASLDSASISVTLQSGDTLYLPAGWWHHVRQKDLTIALNWWYDMEARGMGWVWLNFLRGETGSLLADDTGSIQSSPFHTDWREYSQRSIYHTV